MMNYCWQWMMSLGWIGMLLSVALVVALIALGVTLIARTWGPPRR